MFKKVEVLNAESGGLGVASYVGDKLAVLGMGRVESELRKRCIRSSARQCIRPL